MAIILWILLSFSGPIVICAILNRILIKIGAPENRAEAIACILPMVNLAVIVGQLCFIFKKFWKPVKRLIEGE